MLIQRGLVAALLAVLGGVTGVGAQGGRPAGPPAAPADPRLERLDAYVREQMARRQVPGLSLAIVENGRIVAARAYGFADREAKTPVTPATLFQAGSISKPVSALGALRLVEQGKLSLDAPVNGYLRSWRVPENAFTSAQPVTLRRLLSHTAGVTVHGFPGYAVTERMPTLTEVLDGKGNTAAIRVDTTPGAIWRYSGGGFTIMQQLVIDVTGEPFPAYLRRAVLAPIGMSASSFEQPQPAGRERLMATGYYANRRAVPGRWHVYPEIAAAGLWTTPTDLGRFAIEIQQTLAGKGHGVISPAMARQYLTEEKGGSGLGMGVRGTGQLLRFSHGGRDEGFDALLVGYAASGQALAIMINANDNSGFMDRVALQVARSWGWPETPPAQALVATPAALDPARLASYGGYYELQENRMLPLVPAPDRQALQTLTDGLPDEDFLPVDSVTFASAERPLRFRFEQGPDGRPTGLVWRPGEGSRELHAPRIVPLPSTAVPSPDPDAALTGRIDAALHALAAGGGAVQEAPGIAPGAKRDFARGTPELAGLTLSGYLGESDVAGRGIRRHGHPVAKVRSYRIASDFGPYLLVHLTADGLVTDYDVLQR